MDVLTGEGPRLSRLSARGVTPSPPEVEGILPWSKAKKKVENAATGIPEGGDRATKAQDKAVVAKAATAARARTQAVRVTSHPTGRPPAHSHRATKSQISAHSSRGMAYPGACHTGQIGAGEEIIIYIYGVSTTFRIGNWQKWLQLVHPMPGNVNQLQPWGRPGVNQFPLMG